MVLLHMVKDKKTGKETDTPYTTMDELKDFGATALDDTTIQIKLKSKMCLLYFNN